LRAKGFYSALQGFVDDDVGLTGIYPSSKFKKKNKTFQKHSRFPQRRVLETFR
jgi:hypothetical protein